MNFKKEQCVMFVLIVLGITLLAGCQMLQNDDDAGSNAMSKEQMLSGAGFQMKVAQTQEQLANIQELPQRKFVQHVKDGQNVYVFADAENCRCVYVGAESNYQQYQGMAYQKDLADEKRTTAQIADENFIGESAMMDWDVWGPWEPWR